MQNHTALAFRLAIASGLVVIAVAGMSARTAAPLRAAPSTTAASGEPSDHWLDGLTAKHKQFFDAPTPNGGIPLVHVMNYYDTYNKAYGVKDADIDAVLTFYGGTTFLGLSDAAWAKYKLGEFAEISDPATS